MNALTAFPYKNMVKIVELISEDEVDAIDVQKATSMCIFDSTEVLNMLAFLTSFGRVQRVEGGWIIEKIEETPDYGNFREHFLDDAVAILESLSKTPKTEIEVSIASAVPLKRLEIYLPFLEEITRFGVIKRRMNEFAPKWYVVPL